MKYLATILITLTYITIGILSFRQLNISWLYISNLFLVIVNLVFLRKQWKNIFPLVKKGLLLLLIISTITFIFSFFPFISEFIPKTIIFWLSVGLLSINILQPAFLNSVLLLSPNNSFISNYIESFLLSENIVVGLIREYYLGLISAKYRNRSLFKTVSNATIAILVKIPETTTNLSIAKKVSYFNKNNLSKLNYNYIYYSIITLLAIIYLTILTTV